MLQAAVMVSSIVLVAVLGVINVGGLTEVWNRAVDGNRIFPPEYAFRIHFFTENMFLTKNSVFSNPQFIT